MQLLCPLMRPGGPKPALQWLCGRLVPVVLGLVQPSPAWAAQDLAVAQAALFDATRQWLAQTQGATAEGVTFMPLDSRLQIQACGKPLSMDMPFGPARPGQPGTVRVRCEQPRWQLYLQYQPAAQGAGRSSVAASAQPAGEVKAMATSMALARGSSLGEAQITWTTVSGVQAGAMLLTDPAQLRHMELARDVKAGTVLKLSDVRPAMMVRKGQQVLLKVGASSAFQISARVEAMQDGRHGEVIRVRNPESGKQFKARITGPNQAINL